MNLSMCKIFRQLTTSLLSQSTVYSMKSQTSQWHADEKVAKWVVLVVTEKIWYFDWTCPVQLMDVSSNYKKHYTFTVIKLSMPQHIF